jgi:hypothetical protein
MKWFLVCDGISKEYATLWQFRQQSNIKGLFAIKSIKTFFIFWIEMKDQKKIPGLAQNDGRQKHRHYKNIPRPCLEVVSI